MQLNSRIEVLLKKEIDPVFAARAGFIFSQIEAVKPQRVLDIGCGRGFYLQALANYRFIKSIVGLESNLEYIGKASQFFKNKKIKIKQGSVYQLPFANNSFDFIILSEVLEHLEDEKLALKEIHRVLKKNGQLVVTVPNHDFPMLWDPINYLLMKWLNTHIRSDWWFLAGIWADHQRLYTEKQLRDVLNKNHFKIKKLAQTVFYVWPFSHFILYGIGKNIVEKFPSLSINRFQTAKPSKVANLIASLMSWPNKLATSTNTKKKSGVGLVALLTK